MHMGACQAMTQPKSHVNVTAGACLTLRLIADAGAGSKWRH